MTTRNPFAKENSGNSNLRRIPALLVLPISLIIARHTTYNEPVTFVSSLVIFAFTWSMFAFGFEVGLSEQWPKSKAETLKFALALISLSFPIGFFNKTGPTQMNGAICFFACAYLVRVCKILFIKSKN